MWVYMVEQNMMEGKHNDIDRFIKYINSNSSSVAKEIRKVVNDAKKADNLATSKGRVVVNDTRVMTCCSNCGFACCKNKVTVGYHY